MRIAFVTPEFVTEDSFSGGLANYLYRVSTLLTQYGHEVHVFTRSSQNDHDFVHHGVYVHRVLETRSSTMSDDPGLVGRLYNRIRRMIGVKGFPSYSYVRRQLQTSLHLSLRLRKSHQTENFDIVQYPSYYLRCVFFHPLLLRGLFYTLRISSYSSACNKADMLNRSLQTRLSEWMEKIQIRMSKNVFSPSHAMRTLISQELRKDNIEMIRSPFIIDTIIQDRSIYEQALSGKSYLLYFGRLSPHKGVHILALSLPAFLKKNLDAHFVCVGRNTDTPVYGSMNTYIASQIGEFEERVHIMDALPHSQLYPIIENARLVVLPSLVDNAPNACLEALGLGIPVIGTIGSSLDEIVIDEVNGLLVPANNVAGLQDTLLTAWEHPKLVEMQRRTKSSIAHFDPKETIDVLLDYYGRIISN